MTPARPLKVAFVGGTDYGRPLNATAKKKFEGLATFAEVFVVGIAPRGWGQFFTDYARFYLLPRPPIPFLRYLVVWTLVPFCTLWLIVRHRVRILVAQTAYEGLAAWLARAMARALGRRVALVIESHADLEESLFLERRVFLPGLTRRLMRCLARFIIRRADVLRAVSRSTAEQIHALAPDKPLVQFLTWTDRSAFDGIPDRTQAAKSQVILFAGVLIPRKGVLELVNAFSRLAPDFPEARLLLAGREQNETYVRQVRERIRASGVTERVEFLGELPQHELAVHMRAARVFVLPTFSEGLPRVVLEAMLTAMPVVATRVSGIPEIIEDARNGLLIEPGDEDALASRLRWVLQNPDEAERIGQEARRSVMSRFSTEAYLRGFREVFEQAHRIVS